MGINFFFSSRRRHTRWPRDWSSDVCSSDLSRIAWLEKRLQSSSREGLATLGVGSGGRTSSQEPRVCRSEERRVGKECRARCAKYREKKNQRRNMSRQ